MAIALVSCWWLKSPIHVSEKLGQGKDAEKRMKPCCFGDKRIFKVFAAQLDRTGAREVQNVLAKDTACLHFHPI